MAMVVVCAIVFAPIIVQVVVELARVVVGREPSWCDDRED